MVEIITAITVALGAVMLKKDRELPWFTRIVRWSAWGCAMAYVLLELAEKLKGLLS